MGSVTPPRTIETLLTAARSVEVEMNRARRLGVDMMNQGNTCLAEATAAGMNTAAAATLPIDQQLMALQKEMAEMKLARAGTNKAAITCFRCQKKGHYARECRGGARGGQQRGFQRGRFNRGNRGFNRGNRGGWQNGWTQRQPNTWAVDQGQEESYWQPSEN